LTTKIEIEKLKVKEKYGIEELRLLDSHPRPRGKVRCTPAEWHRNRWVKKNETIERN